MTAPKKATSLKPIKIMGQTASAKNRHVVTYNRLTKKPLLLKNKKYVEWEAAALWQLKNVTPVKNYPTAMTCIFWVEDKRKRDLSNMLQSVEDTLVKAGVIEDDCWQMIRPITVDIAGVDSENPRCEIWFD